MSDRTQRLKFKIKLVLDEKYNGQAGYELIGYYGGSFNFCEHTEQAFIYTSFEETLFNRFKDADYFTLIDYKDSSFIVDLKIDSIYWIKSSLINSVELLQIDYYPMGTGWEAEHDEMMEEALKKQRRMYKK